MADDKLSESGPVQDGAKRSTDETLRAGLSRRELMTLGAAATFAASFGFGKTLAARSAMPAGAAAGLQTNALTFFTPAEFALVDELSEMIVPTDAQSPGARAAKVATFIDFQLGEAWDPKDKTDWRDGLNLVDRLSQDANGKPFMQSTAEQRLAILTRMAQNESKPQKPEELFFKDLKARVVYAYYSSEIGIKQDMEYKGNVFLNEFVGYDVSKPNA